MDDAEPEVKVTDRRHFTSDGERRTEAPPSQVAEGSPVPAAESSGPAEAPVEAPDPAPVTLAGFVISLASQAAGLLGGEQRDLGAARQIISVLEMLKEKTEGRRTEEESKIMDTVLFDLRMAFVGSAKGGGSG